MKFQTFTHAKGCEMGCGASSEQQQKGRKVAPDFSTQERKKKKNDANDLQEAPIKNREVTVSLGTRLRPLHHLEVLLWTLRALCCIYRHCFPTQSYELSRYTLGGINRRLKAFPSYLCDAPTAVGSGTDEKDTPRLILVGDVHGCWDELQALLQKCEFSPERGDKLLLLGDIVGKGPYSMKVLQFARSMPQSVIVLRGNHEQKVLDMRLTVQTSNGKRTFQAEGIFPPKFRFGKCEKPHAFSFASKYTCLSVSFLIYNIFLPSEWPKGVSTHCVLAQEMKEDDWKWLDDLPMTIYLPQFNTVCVHAALVPGVPR